MHVCDENMQIKLSNFLAHISLGGSLVLDIVPGSSSEDLLVGQTLKRSAVVNWPTEDKIYLPKKTNRRVTHRAWKTEQLLGHGNPFPVLTTHLHFFFPEKPYFEII